MRKFILRRGILTISCIVCLFTSFNVFANDSEEAAATATSAEATTPAKSESASNTAAPNEDSIKAVNKVLFDMCVKGMKEGMSDAAKDKKDKTDSVAQADMDVMAEKVCACSAPKLRKALLNDDLSEKKAKSEERAKWAKDAIMSCM